MNKSSFAILGGAGLLAASSACAAPWVAQQAHVPTANGMVAIALVKNNNTDRTLVCRETADALVDIRPDGIAYDTSVKHGKKIVTEEIVDDARIIPVAVNSCVLMQGNHFDSALAKARKG